MLDKLIDWERPAFLFLNDMHSPYLDAWIYLVSAAQTWIGVWIVLAVLIFYKNPKRESLLIFLSFVLLVVLCDQLTSSIIKPYFMRPRPTHYPSLEHLVHIVYGYRGGQYGFVSGHSANYFGLAMLSAMLFKRRGYTILIFSTAVLIAYTRIYLGVHFITDVIPGALVGMLIGICVYKLYVYARRRWVTDSVSHLPAEIYAATCRRWMYTISAYYLFITFTAISVMKATARIVAA